MRRLNISTTMLRSFLEIANEGNVTRAASRLNSTQSTLSHQIHKLEIELGRKLFHRKNNIMEKTIDGEFFHLQANKIIDTLDHIDLYFRPTRDAEKISIGIVNDCVRPAIVEVLNAFNQVFFDVRVDLKTGSSVKLTRQVRDGDVQMAIVRDLASSPTIGDVLWSEQLLWACGPAYRHDDGPLPLIFFPEPCVYRKYALEALKARNVPHTVVVESTSWSEFERSLRGGVGVSLVTPEVCRICGVNITDERLPPAPISHACLVTSAYAEGSPTHDLAERLKAAAMS
jgi:DNA-binding transcriptional LysR family regulator